MDDFFSEESSQFCCQQKYNNGKLKTKTNQKTCKIRISSIMGPDTIDKHFDKQLLTVFVSYTFCHLK